MCAVFDEVWGWDPSPVVVDETWHSPENSGDEDETNDSWAKRVLEHAGIDSSVCISVLEVPSLLWRSIRYCELIKVSQVPVLTPGRNTLAKDIASLPRA